MPSNAIVTMQHTLDLPESKVAAIVGDPDVEVAL